MLQYKQIDAFCTQLLETIHAQCFEKSWTEKDFETLLCLPTTQGVMCPFGFILCSVVKERAEILTLCVVPQMRRQKIAMELLCRMELILKAQNVCDFSLEVAQTNEGAISLYTQFGFKKICNRPKYYHTHKGVIDAFIFKKNLI